jgi:hypothetical protein
VILHREDVNLGKPSCAPCRYHDRCRVRRISLLTTRKSSSMDIVGVKPHQLAPTVGFKPQSAPSSPRNRVVFLNYMHGLKPHVESSNMPKTIGHREQNR